MKLSGESGSCLSPVDEQIERMTSQPYEHGSDRSGAGAFTARCGSPAMKSRGGRVGARGAAISKDAASPSGAEWQLVGEREPPLGSHVVTPRRGYLHHGIYVGGGKIVHYPGLAYGLRSDPVEEVSLACFARGRVVWARCAALSAFDPLEVVRRARSRVGEYGYRLLTNNCEHLCEWCLHGENRSYQVDGLLAQLRRRLQAVVRLFARWRSVAGGAGIRTA